MADVDDEAVADDYALTRVGREPAREMVMARLSKEPLFASNTEAALNMFTCRCVLAVFGLISYTSLLDRRRETMTAFLQLLRDKYGGAVKYVVDHTRFSEVDIEVLKDILRRPQSRI